MLYLEDTLHSGCVGLQDIASDCLSHKLRSCMGSLGASNFFPGVHCASFV